MFYTRSPLARLVSLAIFLGGIGLAAVKISGALHSSDRVDAAARRLDLLSQGKLGSSLVLPSNLRRAVGQVRAAIGAHGRMIEVAVTIASAEFQYATGQRAAGYLEISEEPVLKPEEVTLSDGDPPVSKQAFSLALVDPEVPQRLIRAIRRRPAVSDFRLDSATLSRGPLDHAVEWVLTGTGGGRSVLFSATPSGRGLKRIP